MLDEMQRLRLASSLASSCSVWERNELISFVYEILYERYMKMTDEELFESAVFNLEKVGKNFYKLDLSKEKFIMELINSKLEPIIVEEN